MFQTNLYGWTNLRSCPGVCVGGLRKVLVLRMVSIWPGFEPGHPECEAVVLQLCDIQYEDSCLNMY